MPTYTPAALRLPITVVAPPMTAPSAIVRWPEMSEAPPMRTLRPTVVLPAMPVHPAMAGCAAVAGSAKIGRYCLIGGGAGVLGHLEVCDRVIVTAMSLVTHTIREPGEYSSGTPIMDNRAWRKSAARFKQLDAMARRLSAGDKD